MACVPFQAQQKKALEASRFTGAPRASVDIRALSVDDQVAFASSATAVAVVQRGGLVSQTVVDDAFQNIHCLVRSTANQHSLLVSGQQKHIVAVDMNRGKVGCCRSQEGVTAGGRDR